MSAFHTPWTIIVWLIVACTVSPSLALPQRAAESSQPATPPTITTAPDLSATPSGSSDDGVDCQSQQIAWSSSSSDAAMEQAVWHTYTNAWSQSFTTEYGSAEVYTTSDGFAHARGSFTITSVTTSTSVYVYGEWSWYEWPSTAVYTVPQPTCTIDDEACAALYSSFDSKFYPSIKPTETVEYTVPSVTTAPYTDSETGSDYVPLETGSEIGSTSSYYYYSLSPMVYPQWYDWPLCPRPTPSMTFTGSYVESYATQETFDYYYPYPEPTYSCDIGTSVGDCSVTGRDAQLFYWPATPTVSVQSPRTVVTKGITMTSPSVYLYFEDLAASQLTTQWQDCAMRAAMWQGYRAMGSAHSGSWITLAPSSVSTLEKGELSAYWGETIKPDVALTALQDDSQANETYWASVSSLLWNYYGQYSLVTSSLDFEHVTRPDARAYYLGASRTVSAVNEDYFPYDIWPGYAYWQTSLVPHGCSNSQKHCNTIFDDLYKPQLSLPAEVLAVDPLWASCSVDPLGVYATPIALGEVPSVSATASAVSPPEAFSTARPGSTVPSSGPSATVTSDAVQTAIDTAEPDSSTIVQE